MLISVIIPTYNPAHIRISQVITSLKNQTLDKALWELLIIDNNSTNGVLSEISLTWHPFAKIVHEQQQGLTYSRLRGFTQSKGDILVLVDDDNVLDEGYLANVLDIFNTHPLLGVAGGSVEGEFEVSPDRWVEQFYQMIAVRPCDVEHICEHLRNGYPSVAPIGAGMCVRRTCFELYSNFVAKQTVIVKDRTGNSLSSGGDNEINIVSLRHGYKIGLFPCLKLKHLIPKGRTEEHYLERLNHDSSESWIQLLRKHDICPWRPIAKWTVPFRIAKSYVKYKAWGHPANRIKWKGSCGIYKGLAQL